MKHLKIILIITFLLNNYIGFSQTEFTVTYHRVKANWGIDDFQKLEYKDGNAMFSFFQKKEKKKVDYYEINLSYRKYRNNYFIESKKVIEQNELEDGTLLIAKWKHNMKWKILEETKIMNGYTVQKATIQSYNFPEDSSENFGIATAWFTTDIPVGIGPFRYHGLPGLIIELSFERYGATYKMTTIDFDTPVVIPKFKEGIIISKEQSIRPKTIDKKWLKEQKGETNKKNKSWWQIWD